jgi:DNA topoisomerase I
MKLVIVESNAKCKKIEEYLGSGYKCVASFGHIREITNGLKSIDIENNYNPKFELMSSKSKYITSLRKSIQESNEVILATDDDREGEAIAWHICDVFKLSLTTKRIIFREITKPAIQHAIQNPITIDINKVNAQKARQVLDVLVGYSLSPILWKQITANKNAKLSAGRCQTPALRLIYENYLEIEESPGKEVYDINGYFTDKNLDFKLVKNIEDKENVEKFLEDSVDFVHVFSKEKVRNTEKKSSEPFTTSSLQQSVSNDYHYSPKITMEICQKLYEAGHITYMRTDSKKYSEEFVNKGIKYINENYGDNVRDDLNKITNYLDKEKTDNDEVIDSKKIIKKVKKIKKENNAQEAHEAIRPTDIDKNDVNFDDNKIRNVYKLIRNNTLETLMKNAKYLSITFKITAPDNNIYKRIEEQVVEPGWKLVKGYIKENENYIYLDRFKKKNIEYNKITCKFNLKDLKSHLTEAKLVQLLEQKGIGRPSTFSSLITKIQERKYVNKEDIKGKEMSCIDYELNDNEINEIETKRVFGNEKNKLVITPLGKIVIEFLLKYFNELFVYDYTKMMEDHLDIIALGNNRWYNLCNECNRELIKLIEKTKNEEKKKIMIENYEYVIGKYGPVLKKNVDGKTEFKSIKKDIDINKLKNGEYKLEEILSEKQIDTDNYGNYNGNELIVKTGKFGKYISFNGKTYSLKDVNEIDKDTLIGIINGNIINKSIVREINNIVSIRNGKFGDYIYYKTEQMKKPKFISLSNFSDDYKSCGINIILEWIENKI